MLIIEILLCIFIVILLCIGRKVCNNVLRYKIAGGIAFILAIALCGLLILDWNLFTISKMLLFISICLYPFIKYTTNKMNYEHLPTIIAISIATTLIAYIITAVIYISGFEECKTPDVEITTCSVLCTKDNSSIAGSISGNIFYVQGQISEESIYKYYYQVEGSGIKQGSIPADDTTIYFIQEGEEPYLETIITTTYNINKYDKSTNRYFEYTQKTYQLYVPKYSIKNVFEFDAQ